MGRSVTIGGCARGRALDLQCFLARSSAGVGGGSCDRSRRARGRDDAFDGFVMVTAPRTSGTAAVRSIVGKPR